MRRRVRLALVASSMLPAAIGTLSPAAARQTPPQSAAVQSPTGTGLLMGQVVDGDSGAPVAGALVALGGGLTQVGATGVIRGNLSGSPRRLLTNGQGRFVFLDLPKGGYSIEVTKAGYLSGEYGRRRPNGASQSIDLADGQRLADIRIPVWKYASISGTVTDESGEPAVGVQIWALRRTFIAGRSTLSTAAVSITDTTDDRGAFRLSTLAPGDYLVAMAATRSTVPVSFRDEMQQAQANGTYGEFMSSLIGSAASLSFGVGSPGIRVGDAELIQQGGLIAKSAVGPGPSSDGHLSVYATTFYPGVAQPGQAEVVTLRSGEEREGINLPLRLVPSARVSGRVNGPEGSGGRIGLRLVPTYAMEMSVEENFDCAISVTDATGAFSFLGVPAGTYLLRAIRTPRAQAAAGQEQTVVQTGGGSTISMSSPSAGGLPVLAPIPQGPTYWANVPVTVTGADLSNLAVDLRPGLHLSGRVEFEGAAPKPPPNVVRSMMLTIEPIDGHMPGVATYLRAQFDAAGELHAYAVPPGQYYLRTSAFSGVYEQMPAWTLKSVTAAGRDAGNLPLDIQADIADVVVTYTDHPSEVAGTVRDAQGRPDGTASVLIFPTETRLWTNYGSSSRLVRAMRATKAGTFRFAGQPAGDYYLVAVPDELAGDWQNPDTLKALATSASRVSVADGENKSIDLRAIASIR